MVPIEVIAASDFKDERNSSKSNEQQERQLADVGRLLEDVRQNGDTAVRKYTKQFDRVELDHLRVGEAEIVEAYRTIEPHMLEIIRQAKDNISRFHERQRQNSWYLTEDNGTILGQKVTPLDRVGVYVPGGTAALSSSVLMNVIPAKIAGVKEIVMCTPPGNGALPAAILVAAKECGVTEIYHIGGAQAIAALAYGTETIKKVDKITGPGNVYVALAKKLVYGTVDIDMIAGPSEILVACDQSADAAYVAADMLSQAEHDVMAAAYCVTTSKEKAREIQEQLTTQLDGLSRKDIAEQALQRFGKIIIADNRQQMIEIINSIAAEHLEMLVDDPFSYLAEIRHAGAIFLGPYSAEPVGDYFAGPNHVLPTSGTARFSSPLSVDDFVKKSSVIYYSKQAMRDNGQKIAQFAEAEGLQAHARAVTIRLDREGL